jgi:hypothetical protein
MKRERRDRLAVTIFGLLSGGFAYWLWNSWKGAASVAIAVVTTLEMFSEIINRLNRIIDLLSPSDNEARNPYHKV